MRNAAIAAAVTVLLIGLGPPACNKGMRDDARKGAVSPLAAVEVRQYQGQMLGSVDDFRENSIKGPQVVDSATYRLEITGLVGSPERYTYEEVLAHPKYSKVVTIYCVEGWSVKCLWEGVRVKDLLNDAGIGPLANTVIFHGYDGYTTSLPLDYILGKDILIAYKINGIILPEARGYPFALVAEDKLGYKWIRWITEIELSSDENYKGYWESRGYDNEADL